MFLYVFVCSCFISKQDFCYVLFFMHWENICNFSSVQLHEIFWCCFLLIMPTQHFSHLFLIFSFSTVVFLLNTVKSPVLMYRLQFCILQNHSCFFYLYSAILLKGSLCVCACVYVFLNLTPNTIIPLIYLNIIV